MALVLMMLVASTSAYMMPRAPTPRMNMFSSFVTKIQAGQYDEAAVRADVQRMIEKYHVRRLVHPRKTLTFPDGKAYIKKAPGYAYLSVHYGWALRTLFELPREGAPQGAPRAYEGVIILEEVRPDVGSTVWEEGSKYCAPPTEHLGGTAGRKWQGGRLA